MSGVTLPDAKMDSNGETRTVRVELEFQVRIRPSGEGWFYAFSKYGSVSAHTPEECVRILKERAADGR